MLDKEFFKNKFLDILDELGKTDYIDIKCENNINSYISKSIKWTIEIIKYPEYVKLDFAEAMILYCNMKSVQSLISGDVYDQLQNKHLLKASTEEVRGLWREI